MHRLASMGTTAIELMDGPLQGRLHKVESGIPAPDRIALRDKKDRLRIYWYRIVGERAYFDASEYQPEPLPARRKSS
jgi:hypothetical protein